MLLSCSLLMSSNPVQNAPSTIKGCVVLAWLSQAKAVAPGVHSCMSYQFSARLLILASTLQGNLLLWQPRNARTLPEDRACQSLALFKQILWLHTDLLLRSVELICQG